MVAGRAGAAGRLAVREPCQIRVVIFQTEQVIDIDRPLQLRNGNQTSGSLRAFRFRCRQARVLNAITDFRNLHNVSCPLDICTAGRFGFYIKMHAWLRRLLATGESLGVASTHVVTDMQSAIDQN